MIKLLVALAGVSLINAAPQHPTIVGRITGGSVTVIEQYPYQASLHYLLTLVCGASIISENYAVTAAHCTDGVLISVLYSVRVGSTYPDSGGLFVPVSQVYQEPRFDQWNFDYDISVLKLSTTLTFGPTIAPIRLPVSGENVNSGVLATVTGWGNQIEGEPNSDQLRVVQVPLISVEECRKLYGSSADITDRMFCAGFPEGGKDACQGDSGGPLVVNDTLIGIISWSRGCAQPNLPRIYMNVSVLRDFITEIAGI